MSDHAAPTAEVSVVMDRVTVDYSVATSEPRSSKVPKVLQAVTGLFTPPARTSVHAVKDVSLVAHVGESIGIIGSNGSGKSSLMRALAGLHPPTSGTIYAAHTPVLLGVNAALLPDLPGARNILLGCMAMGLTLDEAKARFDEICELAGIGESIYLPMRTYSSGMAARLNFAIATAVRPKILLIDEALNTGDAEFKARSSQRMDEVRQHAGTVFLVSHSLSTVKSMCSRVLWLERGVLRMDGDPKTVVGQYQEHQKAIATARKEGTRRPAPPWQSGQVGPVPDPFVG